MKTILLIDDSKDNREDFCEILEVSGYCVIAADNGTSGLQKVKEMEPDLILSDVQMAGMNGFEMKEKINEWQTKTGSRNIPFIFLTACSSIQEKQKAAELGANAYLTKPIEINTILETIETIF